jgi:phage host-nuclease inhibitor protein Gam
MEKIIAQKVIDLTREPWPAEAGMTGAFSDTKMRTTEPVANIIAHVQALKKRIEQTDYCWHDLLESAEADIELLPINQHSQELKRAIQTFRDGPPESDVMDAEQIHIWLCRKADWIKTCADRALG